MGIWDYSVFWQEALTQIKQRFADENRSQEFDMWFSSLQYESSKENFILVSLPSKFLQDQFISRKYGLLLEEKLFEIVGISIKINFTIKKAEQKKESHQNEFAQKTTSTGFLQDNKEKQKEPLKKHPDLRSEYTFNSFVMGDNNSFAYNAALAISKNPGKTYNPVLIYGGVGLGKTHLLQAIGNAAYERGLLKVIYITAENFTNEFIQSLHSKTAQKFKNKYRYADILLVDDIHFLQNKEGIQEELFHTFNALYDSYKQLVFTCDRPISELKNMADRLKSRFERGLNVDLLPPKYEIRRAILEKKLEYLSVQLPSHVISLIPNEVIDLIAEKVETNVRDLEASLTKIIAYAELIGNKITIEIAQQQLRDKFSPLIDVNISIDNIQRSVADDFNISVSDLKGKKRTKNVILPRQIAMYIAQELTEFSTTELGIEFGGRDHTTVMHSCQKIKEALLTDQKLDLKIQYLIKTIKDNRK